MVIAGIDEAGYGPLLGPLVVGMSAFRVAPTLCPAGGSAADLWQLLRQAVSPTRDKTARRLHVADSKLVYSAGDLTACGVSGSPSAVGPGGTHLERSVLAFAGLAQSGAAWGDLDTLIASLDPDAARWLMRHPWYTRTETEPFPLAINRDGLGPTINGLRSACGPAGEGVTCLRLAARVTPEGRYNDLVARTRNKATALFSVVAILIDQLLTQHAHDPGGLLIVCDRQGGREHYGEPLRTLFPDWHLTIEAESPALCRYTLERRPDRGGATPAPARATICFQEKGESACLATALGSMVAKYLREALMARFNRWWTTQQPGLTPTAGYYTDAMRFLDDTRDLRQRLGVADLTLIRQR